MRIIILLLIIHIVFSQKTSPRKVYQDYMYANGCKNRLLNKIIASTIYKRNLNTNYNFLNTMIRQHMRQFSEEEILRCYEVITNKIIQDNQLYSINRYDKNGLNKYDENNRKIDFII